MPDQAIRSFIAGKLSGCFPKGCRRILLINPPVIPEHDFDREVALSRRYPVFPPYGLGILNRELKKHGYVSEIVDLNYAIYANGAVYGSWRDCLREGLDHFSPDLCAITCMYSMTHPSLRAVSTYIKELEGDMPVITGGVHPTAASDTVLRDCRGIDFLALREGESSLVGLLEFVNGRASEESIRQLGTLRGEEYVSVDDSRLEEEISEPPDFGQLPVGTYHGLGKIGAYHNLLPDHARASTVLSNRGCRGNCVFCSVRSFYGKSGVRMREIGAVVDEMQFLRDQHGITHFMWLDDDLLFDEERAFRLFKEIAGRRLDITWDASNGVVARSISRELAEIALKSGCIGLTLGIESGNREILRSIRKPSGIEHFRRAASILSGFPGIFTKGFLMLGFQNETVGQIQDTVDLARELSLDWYPIQILTPFPATQVRRQMEQEGLIELDNVDNKFFLGSTGGQRLREAQEKEVAKEFNDLFRGDQGHVPTKEELKDLWFVMDYRVNYEKILNEERPVKLELLNKMLRDICARVPENPLSCMYLGIVEHRLGNEDEAREQRRRAESYLSNSDFWRKRFEVLDLYQLL
jgi:radical SAM superfamily enzyme YgiQ (UPF0313 family)